MYAEIGRRIVEAEQKGKRRADYGEQLIERLSADLTRQFGRGLSARNLEQMRQFYLTRAIPQTVSAESAKQEPAIPTKKSQTASGELPVINADTNAAPSLHALAQTFTLPWSAYMRLLSVKDNHACQFY